MNDMEAIEKEICGCIESNVKLILDERTEVCIPWERWKEILTSLARKANNERNK